MKIFSTHRTVPCVSFGYNVWGQTTSTKVGTITLASYTYEDLPGAPVGSGGGNRTEMLYGNGSSVNYEYDELDRKIKALYNDTGNYIVYRYNAEGSLSECIYMDSNDDVISGYSFEYDSLGRQIRSAEYDSNGSIVQTVEQIYDSIGRLSSQTWTVGDDTYSEGYHYNDPNPNEESPTGDGALSQVDAATGDQIMYSYDELKRPLGVEVRDPEGTIRFRTAYDYEIKEGLETGLVKYRNVRRVDGTLIDGYMYEYDALGNIIGIYESEVAEGCTERRPLALYEYDAQSQLTSEIRYTYTGRNGTIRTLTEGNTYTYDTAGNIIKKQAVKNGLNSSETKYSYNNDQWQDLLTAYDGEFILYEGQHLRRQTNPHTGIVTVSVDGDPTSGNPIHYYNGTHYDMAWQQGRNLVENSFETQDHSSSNQLYWVETENEIDYTYDADGIRTSKTVVIDTYRYKSSSGSAVASITSLTPIEPLPEETYTRFLSGSKTVTHNYMIQNGKVIRETIGEGAATEVLDFIYDSAGNPFALIYTNGTEDSSTYYYVLNYQGDVIKLLDEFGAEVANYQYDAWGEIVKATGGMAEVNPLRYRSYYYDSETGFYYLQSRYYDPCVGRFINADGMASTGLDSLGCNIFVYCGNNPIRYVDISGNWPEDVTEENMDGNEQFKVVGAGIQFGVSGSFGPISGGGIIEVIVYWDTPESQASGKPIVAVYVFGEVDFTIDTQNISDFVDLIMESADLLKMDGVNALEMIVDSYSPGFSASVSLFAVTANSEFYGCEDYEEGFDNMSITVGSITVSTAWSDCCRTYGLGYKWSAGKPILWLGLPTVSRGKSNYWLVWKSV